MLSSIVTHLAIQFFVLVNVVTLVQSKQLHELMTEDEIADTFHTTPDSVPDYHIVKLSHTINKRTPMYRAEMQVFSSGITVKYYLEANRVLFDPKKTRVYTTYQNDEDGPVIYNEEKDMVKAAIELYQSRTSAVVAHSSRNGREINFYGTIGDMYIRPLPTRLQRRATDKTFEHPESGNASWSNHSKHILFPRSLSTSSNLTEALTKELEPGNLSLLDEIQHYRVARAPNKPLLPNKYCVYPSIVITSDFNDERASLTKVGCSDALKRRRLEAVASRVLYLLAFFNQVDLRFRALQSPKVRLNIIGIVIATGYASTPYINNNIVPDRPLYVGNILRSMKQFYRSDFPPGIKRTAKNIVVTLTNQRIKPTCEQTVEHIHKNRLCQDKWGPSIHIVYDNKFFEGMIIVTHKLGYTFGAEHDEDSREIGCRDEDGFIMGTNERDEDRRYLRFSHCSLNEMSRFLRSEKTTCADREPKQEECNSERKVSEWPLPGKHILAADQCRQYGYSGVCRNNPGRCRALKCYLNEINRSMHAKMKIITVEYLPAAAEGTSCGIGKICLDGECVNDPQPNNLVWDSPNRQTVVPWELEMTNPECPIIE